MTTIRVHLAEVPTDVLVHLADYAERSFTVAELVRAVAPPDTPDAGASSLILTALWLLRDMGYAVHVGKVGWVATQAGCDVVDEARAAARPLDGAS